MSEPVKTYASLRAALAAMVVVSAASCSRDAAGAGDAPPPAAPVAAAPAGPAAGAARESSPTVLAEATQPGVPLVVQVLEATRATADTVRVALAFTRTSTGPDFLPLFAGADPADFCMITADGTRRLFLLRDAQNKPVLDGNLEPLKPGERRLLQATFPGPPAQATRVTILLGKLTLRDVPIAPISKQ
jgi:hypothetical protein